MLYASMVEQSLLLQLLQLLGVEAEGVRPQVRPCVDERGAQRFCKRTVNLLFSSACGGDPCVIAWHTQYSFSLFQRSTEKGKEGKGGRLKSNLPSEPIMAGGRYGRHINRGSCLLQHPAIDLLDKKALIYSGTRQPPLQL